eukprot:5082497-Pleurochrysis_carterae.AAC.3
MRRLHDASVCALRGACAPRTCFRAAAMSASSLCSAFDEADALLLSRFSGSASVSFAFGAFSPLDACAACVALA